MGNNSSDNSNNHCITSNISEALGKHSLGNFHSDLRMELSLPLVAEEAPQ